MCRTLSFVLLFVVTARAQGTPQDLRTLYDAGHFQEVVTTTTPPCSADAAFYRGLSLARLRQTDQARETFIAAQQRFPFDARFPLELAGLAFQSKKYPESIHYLRRALHLDPNDKYTTNFLASAYLLEGNLDAAVKYWNRIGKPQLDGVRFEPEPHLNPLLLDHNLTISPRSHLTLDDLQTTKARINSLGIFSSPQYILQAKPDGQFDFVVRSPERNGFGSSKSEALFRLFRGLPYETIYPEYFNAGGRAVNITSLLRWDSDKRRLAVNITAPFRKNPSFHYRIFADARDENWILSPATTSAFGFHSRLYILGAGLDQIVNGKWTWGFSTALVHQAAPALTGVFADGFSLQYRAHLERQLLRIPEKRLTLTTGIAPSFGRNFAANGSSFALLQASTELRWLPGPKSGDYEFSASLSAAGSRGTLPFSDMFMLGIERDSNLLLRGHPGTRDGLKGSAPLARDYALANFDFTRRLFDNGILDLKVGPFVDVARPWQTLQPGVPSWLVDPGVSFKIRVLGSATVTLSYGRNLHDRRNAFYASALR